MSAARAIQRMSAEAKRKDDHGPGPSPATAPEDASTVQEQVQVHGHPPPSGDGSFRVEILPKKETPSVPKDAHESSPSPGQAPNGISSVPLNGRHSQQELGTPLEDGVKDDIEEIAKKKDIANQSPGKTPKRISDRLIGVAWVIARVCLAVACLAFVGVIIGGAFMQHAPKQDYAACKQWHPASAAVDPQRDLDIVFLHGLQLDDGRHAREGTWSNGDGVCWPRDILPGQLAPYLNGKNTNVRIMGIEYNAQASGHRTGDMGTSGPGHKRIAKALFHSLVNSERWSLGRKPFVLASHSYGGLVAKSLVVHCDDLIKRSRESPPSSPGERKGLESATTFIVNFKGFVMYGVPQMGSKLADFASLIPLIRFGKIVHNDLVPLDEEILELTRKFEAAIKNRHVTQFAFGETKEMGFWPLNFMVVNPVSAKGNLHDTEFMELQGTDHVTICKPHTKEAEAVQKFVEIMRGIIESLDASTERIGAPITAAD